MPPRSLMATKSPSCKDPVSQQRYLDEIHKTDAENLCKVLLVNKRSCHIHKLNITIKYIKIVHFVYFVVGAFGAICYNCYDGKIRRLSFHQSHHHLYVKNGRAGFILPGLPYGGIITTLNKEVLNRGHTAWIFAKIGKPVFF